jgi:hypothetical protein
MRKVTDSNYLQTAQLKEYLCSPSNQVVLTDYVAMEAYKGNSLKSLPKSMSVLCRYPRQVLILKGTQEICGLGGRKAGLQRRMIDVVQSRGFPRFCKDLEVMSNGKSPNLSSRIVELGNSATEHIDSVRLDAQGMTGHFRAIQQTYNLEEIALLRRSKVLSNGVLAKLQKNTLILAAFLLRDHPKVHKLPGWPEITNTLIFRFALCMELLILDWISYGSQMEIRVEPKSSS